jgi:hypothetical protein
VEGDSIKRKLKEKGEEGLQGEFGIGLLSFETASLEAASPSASSTAAPTARSTPS